MHGDYIKIDRSILEWEWYTDINTKVLFFHMLLKANWKDGNFRGTTVPRGSFVSSIRKLSEETGLTEREIRTGISHLKSTGEVTQKGHSKYSVFTVNNYDIYQITDTQSDNQETINRHSNDKLTTTIEERKKERKEEIYRDDKSSLCQTESVRRIVVAWNSLSECGIRPVSRLSSGSKRYASLTARLNEYGESEILRAIENIKHSDFLQGKGSGRPWVITFDWFVLPGNFPKVLEGNYDNRAPAEKKRNVKDNNNFERRNYDFDALERGLIGDG